MFMLRRVPLLATIGVLIEAFLHLFGVHTPLGGGL